MLWERKDQISYFRHDNAPSHRGSVTIDTIYACLQAQLQPNPPYSPDLAACDFYMFPEAKKPLRGIHVNNDGDLIQAFTNSIYATAKGGLRHLIYWLKRCRKCVAHGGDYFEGEWT